MFRSVPAGSHGVLDKKKTAILPVSKNPKMSKKKTAHQPPLCQILPRFYCAKPAHYFYDYMYMYYRLPSLPALLLQSEKYYVVKISQSNTSNMRKSIETLLLVVASIVETATPFPLPHKSIFSPHSTSLSYRKTSLIHHDALNWDGLLGGDSMWSTVDAKRDRDLMKQFRSVCRRLDTAEDKLDIHKLSSALYLTSSFHILSAGGANGFSTIPKTLEASTYCFLATSIVQATTSIDMAIKYRNNDPIVREGFINMSFNMMSLGWAALMGSPFRPGAISEEIANEIMLLLLLPVLGFSLVEMFSLPERVENRKKRKNEKGGDLGLAGDLFSYVLPTVAGLVAALAGISILSDPSRDSVWLEDVFGAGDGLVGVHAYYSGILTSLAIAVSALSITLRDRKMIPKQSEQLLIGIPSAMFVLAQLKALNIV